MENREIPSGWIETTLGEVVELVGGGTPKTSVTEYWNGNIPWLSVVDFGGDNRWVSSTEKSITELGLKNSSTKLLGINDLIISARGTVGELAQLKKVMAFNQSCYGIKKIDTITDTDFLYYLVKFSIVKLKRKVHGAVFDTITRQTFDTIDIILPPLPEQKAIADVLSSLDEKIELLEEENKTLETLAQTIFTEWFVNFNFPGRMGEQCSESGTTSPGATGEMEDSELGEIPKGWRVVELRELFSFVKGKKPRETSEKFLDDYLPQILIDTFDGGKPCYGLNEKIVLSSEEDLLMVMDGASSGRIEFGFSGIVGSTLALLKIERNIKSVLYFFLKQKENDIKSNTTGSAIPHTDKERVYRYKIAIDDEIINELELLLTSFRKKIILNREQIQTLKTTRDTLLPKLMSGEIRVEGFGG